MFSDCIFGFIGYFVFECPESLIILCFVVVYVNVTCLVTFFCVIVQSDVILLCFICYIPLYCVNNFRVISIFLGYVFHRILTHCCRH